MTTRVTAADSTRADDSASRPSAPAPALAGGYPGKVQRDVRHSGRACELSTSLTLTLRFSRR